MALSWPNYMKFLCPPQARAHELKTVWNMGRGMTLGPICSGFYYMLGGYQSGYSQYRYVYMHIYIVGPRLMFPKFVKLLTCRRTMYLKTKHISCKKPTAKARPNEI